MSYLGEVKNGVIVLEEGAALAEGTKVRVEPVEASNLPTLAERLKGFIGTLQGLPPDMARIAPGHGEEPRSLPSRPTEEERLSEAHLIYLDEGDSDVVLGAGEKRRDRFGGRNTSGRRYACSH